MLLLAALFAASQLRLQPASAAPLTWSSLTPDASSPRPPPRRGAALVHDAATARLVLWGGAGPTDFLTDLWVFHLTNNSWVQSPQDPSLPAPEPRHTFVYGLYVNASGGGGGGGGGGQPQPPQRSLIVSTGQAAGRVLGDIWALDLDALTWRRLPDQGDVPKERYGSAGGVAPALPGGPPPARFWLSHGFSSVRFSDTRYYDLAAERWVLTHGPINSYSPSGPHARCIVSSTVTTDERLVLYGGCAQNGGTGGPCPSRDAWVYDTPSSATGGGASASGGWRQASTCPTPRTRGAMEPLASPGGGMLGAPYGRRYVLLYGGYERDKQTISVSTAPDDEAPVLDLETGEWRMIRAAGDVPPFRGQPASAADLESGRVFVFGGQLRRDGSFANDLYVLQGDPEDSPVSRRGCGRSFLFPHLHGILMGLAWGVLLQAGWFIARYFKPHDPTWFHLHRACQVSGLVLSVVGLGVVLAGGVKASNLGFSHGAIGLTAMGLALTQPLNAFFRPHKGQPRRQQWEWLHLTTGRAAVLLGAANVSLGTFLVAGPSAVWIAWHALLAVFAAAVVVMEVRHQRALRRAKGAAAAGGGRGGGGGSMTRGSLESGSEGGLEAAGGGGKLADVAVGPIVSGGGR
ncbi:hypothetical protein GPECTOR_40g539 [Gonium pectorale]|uniref:Cytochrome b561 domain-containing protein n=1 Tax=Gonium pectorale TaxID=33097 RepID=A0A150GB43_GONPE|nr:hypothetical protein GPECTOR_40g539 [Gonium pectorale]|eukprot:KXZ46805.1 hypothetical protein GPECTOR_40g539 [Gonium pectorale]